MGVRLRPAIYCFAAALALCLVHPPVLAQPQPADSTHYWTYHLNNPLYRPEPIQVKDQFFRNYRDVQVQRLERLLNPVWKRHGNYTFPPRDSTAHMTWWDLPDEPIYKVVRVRNQFWVDGQTLRVDSLSFLLAPAWKTPQPIPPYPPPDSLNHYLCYKVIGAPANQQVTLRDQFHQQDEFVTYPAYLCNPCWKYHNGHEYAPPDTTNHLVLYELSYPDYQAPGRYLTDQFYNNWPSTFWQRPKEYLAVPSTKRDITATAVPLPGDASNGPSILSAGPNPMTDALTVRYSAPRPEAVTLEVFAASGRLIRSLRAQAPGSGTGQIVWNREDQEGRRAPPGIYLYSLKIGNTVLPGRKLLVLR